MKLSKLLKRTHYELIKGNLETEVTKLVYDSRNVVPGACFVCLTGCVSDGHEYIDNAIKDGAAVIIAEREVQISADVTVILVNDTRAALGNMSAAFFDYPAEKLKCVGITGTKGKTTTAYMIYSILNDAGIKTGLIGTIEVIIGEKVIPSSHTTPESYMVQQYFAQMVECGVKCVVMEVSSQGLKLQRVSGFIFDIGVFTNLEADHISPNEHATFEEYLECKSRLFRLCKIGIANADDKHMKEVVCNRTCELETYGIKSRLAGLCAKNINLHNSFGSMGVEFDAVGLMNFHVKVDIPGRFTVYNALAAIAVCRHFDISEEKIQDALLKAKVKGRVELVNASDKFVVLIDYAHNAMSMQSLLSTMKDYNPKRLVCLFGCGGNRARDRRFEMGGISSQLADLTVVTSDNPRYEKPEDIIEDIIVGVKRGGGKYISIIDRREAIRYCLENAQEGDVIVIAGKGHEDYQEICGIKYPMDDRVMVSEIMEELNSK